MTRKRSSAPDIVEVVFDKLVHGGQAIGTLPTGQKVFAWNVLPGERARVEVRASKKAYLEGVAVEILEASPERIVPRDEAYLSTSPWQIMTFDAENKYKQAILAETFAREHVRYEAAVPFYSESKKGLSPYEYRNKMEYSFWADDDGLHLALYQRASHGKRIVTGSSIAMPAVDASARAVCAALNRAGIRGSQLKTVIVRATQGGETAVALFVKDEAWQEVPELADCADGVVVYYSNPKSPASVATRELFRYGSTQLTDTILGVPISYDVTSFFQVNLPVFSQAAEQIADFVQGDEEIIDMYAGTGTIALVTGASKMVELDPANIATARANAQGRQLEVIAAASENALDYIAHDATIIVDPPRAGLHQKVVDRINENLPNKLAYLSCNPITQARDIALLQDNYAIESLTGYNFFPRTPHIESLALLRRK